jgi:hypothetical protein
MKKLQDYAAGIVLAHILISGFDHLAHQRVDLAFALVQNVVILSVITVSPFVGASLLYTRYQRAGAIILLSTMAVAFVFNVYHRLIAQHTAIHSPDFAPYWETIFILSSALILVTEVLGCWISVKLIRYIETPAETPRSKIE